MDVHQGVLLSKGHYIHKEQVMHIYNQHLQHVTSFSMEHCYFYAPCHFNSSQNKLVLLLGMCLWQRYYRHQLNNEVSTFYDYSLHAQQRHSFTQLKGGEHILLWGLIWLTIWLWNLRLFKRQLCFIIVSKDFLNICFSLQFDYLLLIWYLKKCRMWVHSEGLLVWTLAISAAADLLLVKQLPSYPCCWWQQVSCMFLEGSAIQPESLGFSLHRMSCWYL